MLGGSNAGLFAIYSQMTMSSPRQVSKLSRQENSEIQDLW